MDLSSIPFLATALAIVISWALFAIFCSLLQECVAQILADRGRFMKKYLLKQLQDLSNGVNWASMFYLHGTIDLLSRRINKPTSDISPDLFARTIVEVVGSAHLVQMQIDELKKTGQKDFKDEENNYKHSVLYNYKAAMQVLKPSDVVSFFSQALKDAELRAGVGSTQTIDEAAVYNHLTENLDKWFQEFTQRLQLWYKKKIRGRLFVLGILLGILLNIDSMQLFDFYNHSPESRAAVIKYYETNSKALNDLANRVQSPLTQDSLLKLSKTFINSADSLRKTAVVPVGIKYSIFKTFPERSFYAWLMKILGVLISGFAASFGAPFWFDLLRKVYTKNP